MREAGQEIHVVVQERTGLFRKVGTTFLTVAVLVASATILIVVFAGDAPEPLLVASLVLAGIGIGLAGVDAVLRMARAGLRASWRTMRERRARRDDPAAIRARIAALETEIEALRQRLGPQASETEHKQEVHA